MVWPGPDRWNCSIALVQATGASHYHGLPEGLVNRLGEGVEGATDMIAGGFAADGFPFYLRYSYRDLSESLLVCIAQYIKFSSGYRVSQASDSVTNSTTSADPSAQVATYCCPKSRKCRVAPPHRIGACADVL